MPRRFEGAPRSETPKESEQGKDNFISELLKVIRDPFYKKGEEYFSFIKQVPEYIHKDKDPKKVEERARAVEQRLWEDKNVREDVQKALQEYGSSVDLDEVKERMHQEFEQKQEEMRKAAQIRRQEMEARGEEVKKPVRIVDGRVLRDDESLAEEILKADKERKEKEARERE